MDDDGGHQRRLTPDSGACPGYRAVISARLRSGAASWKGNDLRDLNFLCCAAGYVNRRNRPTFRPGLTRRRSELATTASRGPASPTTQGPPAVGLIYLRHFVHRLIQGHCHLAASTGSRTTDGARSWSMMRARGP
jgi:hypothetical protein